MTRKITLILLALLLIASAAGCGIRTNKKRIELPDPAETEEHAAPLSDDSDRESVLPEEKQTPESDTLLPETSEKTSEPENNVTEAVFKQDFIAVRMEIPEGWEFAFQPEISEAGIRFWQAGNPDAYAELFYGSFGVCGTGLEQVPDTFAGYPVQIGYYDGKKDWDFVYYQDAPGEYWAWNQGLTGSAAEEALQILSSAEVGEEALLCSDAVQIAEESAPDGHKNRSKPQMDPTTGNWTITLTKDESRMTVTVSPDGTVLSSADID